MELKKLSRYQGVFSVVSGRKFMKLLYPPEVQYTNRIDFNVKVTDNRGL